MTCRLRNLVAFAGLLGTLAACSSSGMVGKALKSPGKAGPAQADTSSGTPEGGGGDAGTGTAVDSGGSDQPVWVNSTFLTCDWHAAPSDTTASVLCGLQDQDQKPVRPDPAKAVVWAAFDDTGSVVDVDTVPTGSGDRIEQLFAFTATDVAHRRVGWSVAPATPTAAQRLRLASSLPGLKDGPELSACFAAGTKAKDCLVKLLPAAPAEAPPAAGDPGALLFGGMWGLRYDATTATATYPNPATGGGTCPDGYTADKILGLNNIDYALFYCYRRPQPNDPAPPLDFGGIVGYHQNAAKATVAYPNPPTGAGSCPTGFAGPDVFGSAPKDYMMVLCERPHQSGGWALKFGGFYSVPSGPTMPAVTIPNPLTGAPSCPAGYKAAQVFGTPKVDMTVVLCYL